MPCCHAARTCATAPSPRRRCRRRRTRASSTTRTSPTAARPYGSTSRPTLTSSQTSHPLSSRHATAAPKPPPTGTRALGRGDVASVAALALVQPVTAFVRLVWSRLRLAPAEGEGTGGGHREQERVCVVELVRYEVAVADEMFSVADSGFA